MNLTKNIPPEMLIDPAKIIAKLHLSGKTQVSTKGVQIVNTGIVNDSNNGPDKPGKTTFNLDSKNGEYEIGAVVDVNFKADFKKIREDVVKSIDEVIEGKDITADKEEISKAIQEMYSKANPDDKQPLDPNLDAEQLKVYISKILQRKALKESFEKEMNGTARETADKSLGEYMKMFAGDKYKAAPKDKLVAVEVPSGFSGSSQFKDYVKDFVIQPIKQDEEPEDFGDDEDVVERTKTMCFKVKFKILKQS